MALLFERKGGRGGCGREEASNFSCLLVFNDMLIGNLI